MKLTIKHVALQAGVSVATVSRVLNDKGGISKPTADKVLDVIKELNYIPGPITRTLFKRDTRTIGLLVPKLSNEYWSLVSEIIQEELWMEGYSLLLCSTDRQIEKESAYIQMFIEREVDGIILCGSSLNMELDSGYSHLELIRQRNIPLVTMDPNVPGFHCVVGDHLQGATDAVNYLIKLGHRNIAYIGGPAVSVERELGYRKAFITNGLEVNDSLIKIGESESFEFGDRAISELLASHENFTAVFCGNDAIAIGALNTLHRNHKRVPEDIAVVGYDDIKLAGLMQPALTTVRQPLREMSKAVIKLLFDIMQDPSLNDLWRKNVFQMELIVRESCGG